MHSHRLLFISFGYRAWSIAALSCANPAGYKAVDPVNGYHNNNILILFYPLRVQHAATTTISPRESPERIQYLYIIHNIYILNITIHYAALLQFPITMARWRTVQPATGNNLHPGHTDNVNVFFTIIFIHYTILFRSYTDLVFIHRNKYIEIPICV